MRQWLTMLIYLVVLLLILAMVVNVQEYLGGADPSAEGSSSAHAVSEALDALKETKKSSPARP